MSSSRQIDLTAWQRQQTEEQILRLETLLGSDVPEETKERANRTIRYLNSPESRRYIAQRNKLSMLKKEK